MSQPAVPLGDADWLRTRLHQFEPDAHPAHILRALIEEGWDRLPMPGTGRTRLRWRALGLVAAHDLSLAKLFEGHTDALAILDELGAHPSDLRGALGTWAAEAPGSRMRVDGARGDVARVSGVKAWCSGAARVDWGLMTVWNGSRGPLLALVDMHQSGVRVESADWQAVGMRDSESFAVVCDSARARLVGGASDYLRRPGFWQGGCGVAACWYGAAAALAERLAQRAERYPEPHALAHLGSVDVALSSARVILEHAAQWIDAHPRSDAHALALRVRCCVERAVEEVVHHAGRALGAGPFCMDRWFARTMADLPVFVRQSHAERDLADLGARVATEGSAWAL